MRKVRKALARVLYNRELSPSYYRMGLYCREISNLILPGQFLMVRPWSIDRFDPLLNRPFCVYRVIGEGEGVEILYKVVGRGTRIMADLKPDGEVLLIGPLGRGFPVYEGLEEMIIVSGGVGIAPFYHLIQWMKKRRGSIPSTTLYHGGKGADDLVCIEDFAAEGVEVIVATEDGASGFKGLISDCLKEGLEKENLKPSVILACGPKGMLKEIAGLCVDRDIPCYVSLDRMMGCGIGTCLGCVVKTREGYKRVCMEGPVFEAREVIWEDL